MNKNINIKLTKSDLMVLMMILITGLSLYLTRQNDKNVINLIKELTTEKETNKRLKKDLEEVDSQLKQSDTVIENENVTVRYKSVDDGKYEIDIVDKNNGVVIFDDDDSISFQTVNLKSAKDDATALKSVNKK